MVTTSSSNAGPQVFINFRGKELRKNFVSRLYKALRLSGINAFIDSEMAPGQKLINLFKRIEESKIALAILSSKYTESEWCLEELVKMKECSTKGEGCNNLLVIPIFYKLDTSIVEGLEDDFGINLLNLWRSGVRDDRIVKWNAALEYVLSKAALILEETGEEAAFLARIVTTVQNALTSSLLQSQEHHRSHEGEGQEIPKSPKFHNRASSRTEPGEEQRLKQLEEKLGVDCNDDETRIVGVVGMAGIGKTYLAEKLFLKLKKKIGRYVFIHFDSDKTKNQESDWPLKRLVEGLLKADYSDIERTDGNALEYWKNRLIKWKVVVVFDNVSDQKQIEPLLGNRDWIKKGSRIVITTRDKSLTEGLISELYEVPALNASEGLEIFSAQICSNLQGNFMEMSRKFLDYAGGNPLALKSFGEELNGKTEGYWKARFETLTQVSNEDIRKVLRNSYENDLDEKQKDAFLDIVCFFRSQDENYVTSLLDSSVDPEAGREVRDLVDKFLIHISNGRVEMHDLFFTMGRELVETTTTSKYWMLPSSCAVSTDELRDKKGRDKVRGIVIDMSKVEEMPLDNQVFDGMSSLMYLKVYNSLSPRHGEAHCNLNLPDGLEFPKDNIVRYFHWMKFPGKELPSDFEPKNLVDLRLPYSKLIRVWNCAKDTPKLKWVDLSHSSKLTSLSGLLEAPNILRLNLEGCTSLEELPEEIKKMKNLVFLNLKGCTSLLSLPKITMDSLKTLILSDCTNLQSFEVISESIETLYLNGTAIGGLPLAIGNLHKLISLNLKDCKNLATIPDCLGKLKSLQELKLSRCSKLEIFSEITKNLRVLLLDGTSITKVPRNIIDVSLLRRLCLSRNDKINSLEFDMDQLFHMKWLELKDCKNLTSLSRLPPNLQSLNAHACTSLRTVATPLTLLMPTEQIHSIFIFTNCYELEQVSKNSIISYLQKKSELMADDRYNQEFVFKSLIGTCFPGCEVPAWFSHQALGSVLKLELPRDWNEGRLIGVALCAVVSFKDYKDQNKSLQVKCTCNVSLSQESFIVGGWSCSEPGDEPDRVVSDHVFIGYTTLFKFASDTEVSFRFEVTNGTSEVLECKVMKCGFSLVYVPDEAEKTTSWESTTRMENSGQDHISADDDDDCPSEANSDATPTTRKHNFLGFSWR